MRTSLSAGLPRFLQQRLSREGAFGLQLTIGLVLIGIAAWTFADIAFDVESGAAITLLDVRLATWFHTHAAPALITLMLAITWMHSVPGILTMAALAGAWFWRRKAWHWLLALVLTVPGGMLLNVLLKHIFHRARPHFDDPLLTLPTYSFPSGHTAGATVLYGLLACYLVSHSRSRGASVAIVALAVVMVALVALSRVVLGAHYLSDVLAAAAEGCAWVATCVTAVSTLRRHRMGHASGAGR
jgi:membrane-associated phospholipid phosphatase